MRRKQYLLIGGFLLLGCSIGLSQTQFTVQGVVKDFETDAALSGANVLVEDIGLGSATDEDGRFQIANIVRGTHTLSVSFMGYHVYKIKLPVNQNLDISVELKPQILLGQEVVITAGRAQERETPVAFSNMDRSQIQRAYWAQDVPMLLAEMPNVFSYSDAGNGIGYSYLKIRGFDQKRVGVMINGIPLNDPEDHQVYWVDIPDFAANIEDIQIQRGVTNSLYGVSAFGGSINLLTSTTAREKGISINIGAGSYDTEKFSVALKSGLIDNTYAVYARFSRIVSDGYRDRSGVDLWSYFLSAAKFTAQTTTRINVYGGPELTYAAWDAVQENILKTNRTFNPTSERYENTIDNFNQPHYELIHDWQVTPTATLTNTLFYVKGKGYYEGFKTHKKLTDFGLQPITTADSNLFGQDSLEYYQTSEIAGAEVLTRDNNGLFALQRTDLVRQKWVEKDHIGWLPRFGWNHKGGKLSVGGEVSSYRGKHWGKVIWAAGLPGSINPELTYYTYFGDKITTALYVHELAKLTSKLQLMGDLQFQFKKYRFHHQPVANFVGSERNEYEIDYQFLNPKIGVNYNLSNRLNVFGNFSLAQREPADDDYYDTWDGPDDLGADPLFATADTLFAGAGVEKIVWKNPLIDPEKVYDFELGIGYRSDRLQVKVNGYFMDFRNEIIPYGQVDDDGNPIRGNAEKTVHRGLEFLLKIYPSSNLQFSGNLSLSDNYYSRFIYRFWDENWNVVPIDYSGNTIPLFPSILGNLRLTYHLAGFTIFAHAQHVGRQYLDNTESDIHSIQSFSVLNVGLSYQLRNIIGFSGLAMSVRINNALDKEYETSGYYDPWAAANFFYPAATRNFYVSLSTDL